MTEPIPIRSALSVVVVPGDPNGLKKETPTIAEFYPIEHGFDEMKHFGAYYPGARVDRHKEILRRIALAFTKSEPTT